MGMGTPRCPNCGRPIRPGIRYCENCHEPVDAELVTELRDLYAGLQYLEGWVRAGKGDYTVGALREEAAARYLELRMPAAKSAVAVAEEPPDVAVTAAEAVSTSTMAAPARPAAPVVAAETALAGPVFSWRAFIAEQAIAIMAYLGGFLLLVATLTFEVGGWQVLDNTVKLAAVCGVYVLFGILGLVLPRAASLRTVGRAYLGVFALMTPLVALAVYRFELAQQGFSSYGMLCLAAAYAAVVYLALAWRTRFATYAYLGWSAAAVAALAIVPWLDVDRTWWLPELAVVALGLLLPNRLRRFATMAAVEEPARQLAAIASVVAALAMETAGLLLVSQTSVNGTAVTIAPTVFALATVALVPLAGLWSVTLRQEQTRQEQTSTAAAVSKDGSVSATGPAHEAAAGSQRPQSQPAQAGDRAGAAEAVDERRTRVSAGVVDAVDWLTAVLVAQAAVAVAWWLGADNRGMSSVLTVAALGEMTLAVWLRRGQAARRGLRYGVEGLALALAAIAPVLVWQESAPNWWVFAALVAGVLVTASVAVMEAAPWWLLASGLYLTLAYRALLHAVLPADVIGSASWPYDAMQVMSACMAGLALGVWAVALVLSSRSATRRYAVPLYAVPLYAVALGDALYSSAMLVGQPAVQQTIILTFFAVAALVAGRREEWLIPANVLFGFFGGLAVLPYAAFDERAALVVAAALMPAVVALVVRRGLGRRWAFGAYAVGVWAALLAFWQLQQPEVTTADASWLGVSLACWMLLVVAALAAVAASWEGTRWALAVPAGLALLATAYVPNVGAQVALVFALAAVGAGWRWVTKASWWGVTWHGAALLASGVAGARLLAMVAALPAWALLVPLGFGAVAYLVAAQEREPLVTPIGAVYAVAAIWAIPGAHPLVPTLVLTFGLVGLGVALRLRFGVRWALAAYGAAAAGSLFAVVRVVPPDAGMVEALLLVFAAVAYGVAAQEREPLAGIAPALYICGAVVAQPDAHALLPLALACGVAALVVGRVAGPRWSWPLYAAGAINAAAAAVLARGDLRFEAIGLAAIAALAYIVAAIESRPDLLPLAFLAGGLALASAVGALDWAEWQRIASFAGLGWVYYAGAALWRRMPWLRERRGAWWADLTGDMAIAPPIRDVRLLGAQVHWWSGLSVAAGVCVVAVVAPDSFAVGTAATQVVVVALLSCGAMLAVHARTPGMHALWYVAGELLALAVTWQARVLGADNIQAFVLAPGSYQIVVGALLPADTRVRSPARLGQGFSLAGSLVLLLPTLAMSFGGEAEWVYALLLAVEALAIAGVGVGTRSRLLVLTGSVFVGAAALRGAALAVTSGVPVAVVIAGLALLLMGGATWLSLRSRRGAEPTA